MLLSLTLTTLPLVNAFLSHHGILLPRQNSTTEGPCMTECAAQLNATTACVPSTDAFCGCTDWLATESTCNTCLTNSNATLLGFLNSTYVNFITAVCHCQLPTCSDLTLVLKACTLQNANETCGCAAVLKDAPECYACLAKNDPEVKPALDARVALCQAYLNVNASSMPSQSGSASATASQSAMATLTSASSTIGLNKWGFVVGGLLSLVFMTA